ncbi:MAG: hypothetical protein KIS77_20825 [Saprospiraceae bacterium]|nr:hypothetical protein [Saprospiraceae bacterium]
MNQAIQTIFASRIENLQGFDFEDFVKELLLAKYSPSGFSPTRPRKDRGSDGFILDSQTVVASYGPKRYNHNDFIKKVNDDYEEFRKHWQATFPNWQMFVNHKLDPLQQPYISSKHFGSVLMGLDQIMSIIAYDVNISATARRHLADFLKIDRSQYFSSYLSELLENLLSGTQTDPTQLTNFDPDRLTAIKDKIQLNYTQDDLESAYQEFETVLPLFEIIESHMAKFDDDEKSRLKYRVVKDYNRMGGEFKQRLDSLVVIYLREFANEKDDDYQYNVTAVLLYLFEQCLIGKKKEANP